MCTVSMVIETITTPRSPNYIPWSYNYPTPDIASELIKVIKRLEVIDEKLGLLDCKIEEATKKKFINKLKRRANKKTKKGKK